MSLKRRILAKPARRIHQNLVRRVVAPLLLSFLLIFSNTPTISHVNAAAEVQKASQNVKKKTFGDHLGSFLLSPVVIFGFGGLMVGAGAGSYCMDRIGRAWKNRPSAGEPLGGGKWGGTDIGGIDL
jgi:hypothetical protein